MSENVLVIGGGGREHAICWSLAKSPKVKKVFAAPGNVGIGAINKVENVNLNIKDFKAVSEWCIKEEVVLVAVGPEDPLANGIADYLTANGIKCFGPHLQAARIESDKDWAKRFMDEHHIPTARWQGFTSAEAAVDFINSAPYNALVVKAAGLAAGKGVVVAANRAEACAAVTESLVDRKFGVAGDKIIVEELLEGPEVSVLGFCDGSTVRVMLPAQDHKRALDGDLGPNTGGMGAYCPCPLLTSEQLQWVEKNVLQRVLDGFMALKVPFIGVLYAGLMLTKDGPKVLEFNCRFGDPETEAILPLLKSDLFEIMLACCERRLKDLTVDWATDVSVVGVVMASKGYPQSSSKGDIIQGVDEVANTPGCQVFHSGTATADGRLVTAGGRVLVVVAEAGSLSAAAALATAACRTIQFPGAQFRSDIAHKGIPRWILQQGKLTYKASGVDISAGDQLVSTIKPAVAATTRAGVMGQLGGFGALFDVKAAGYKDPILVSGTDGVGTKLKIAQECGRYSTLGQDLVAMCVNDVLCQGAAPLFFLDYFACGRLAVEAAAEVVSGIAAACTSAGCSLVGGETAEMPGLYKDGDFDLAGFVVGAVERGHLLPRVSDICDGDVVLGLPSAGLHSNGYSLVRRVMDIQGLNCESKSPFSDRTLGEELLPTKLYVQAVLPLVDQVKANNRACSVLGEELLEPTKLYVQAVLPLVDQVKAMAHITGGGLVENIPRVLPADVIVRLDASRWTIPPVFGWIATAGVVSEVEMLRTFNCGVGLVLIVAAEKVAQICSRLSEAVVIGSVYRRNGAEPQVVVENFAAALEPTMQPNIGPLVAQLTACKRVAVLISGSGTNLQALIDATAGNGSVAMGAQIVVVISNKPGVEGLRRAQEAGIRTEVIQHTNYPSRLAFDEAVHKRLVAYRTDIVCLAGFMRVLTGDFVRKWRGNIINIHPALLPLFKGTHAHRQALEAGVRVTGCTVHFVEEDIDNGAIIAQKAVHIEVGDTEHSLAERVKIAEHAIYPQALKLLATGKIHLDDNTNKIVWN